MIRHVILAFVAASLAVPAVADRGHGNKRGQNGAVRQVRNDGCPPGLAKKNNGCQPPGQAKKSYVVGRRLPTTVRWYEPEPVVIRRLAPAPVGRRYVVVDGDLLLMEIASRLIVKLVD
jgi:Ni/Co efflux regulator RcnB